MARRERAGERRSEAREQVTPALRMGAGLIQAGVPLDEHHARELLWIFLLLLLLL
jgi:hypothetical protein